MTPHFDSKEPCIELLGDGRNVMVIDHDIRFFDSHGKLWLAPVGTETDGASIPGIFWSSIGGPFDGKYRDAAILHDYAYQQAPGNEADDDSASHSVSRAAADTMLREAMIVCGVSRFTSELIFAAVKFNGGGPWSSHARKNLVLSRIK